MITKHILSATILTLVASFAFAGLVQPAPVDVDLDNSFAQGDQLTARTSTGDTEFIGCGTRVFDDGMGNSFVFGFCQASDADGDEITCFTQSPALLDAMKAIDSYAFITFNWDDDGFGGAECIRVGFSTQSFYLPDPNIKPKGK